MPLGVYGFVCFRQAAACVQKSGLGISNFLLAIIIVHCAFAVSTLVASVNHEDLWFIAATLRTGGTISVRRSVLVLFCFLIQHSYNAPILSPVFSPCKTPEATGRNPGAL